MARPVKNTAGVNRIAAPKFDAVKCGRRRVFDRCPLSYFDCRQHVISAVQRFFPVRGRFDFCVVFILLHDFVRESRNQIQRFLCDVHQTNRAVPQFRIRNDIRNQMFRKSVAACADKYDLCHYYLLIFL